jgi:hypothetical protein
MNDYEYLFENRADYRGCYEIPVVGVPGPGNIGNIPGTQNLSLSAGGLTGPPLGNLGAYLSARGVGLSPAGITALTPSAAQGLAVSVGTTIPFALVPHVEPIFSKLPLIGSQPSAPPPRPSPTPSGMAPHAPTVAPTVYNVGTSQFIFSGTPAQIAQQEAFARSVYGPQAATPLNPTVPPPPPSPPSPPPAAQPPPLNLPARILGRVGEIGGGLLGGYIAAQATESPFAITEGVQLGAQLGQEAGQLIGQQIGPPASYYANIGPQPQYSTQPTIQTPNYEMEGPINTQFPQASRVFQAKAQQPGFQFGNYCPTCDPTLMNDLRAQCPDCSPQELDQIVAQSVHGDEPREQILLRAQQQQLQKQVRSEQQTGEQQRITQRHTEIERLRSQERTATQTPQTMQQQLQEKQQLLEQIAQELQQLESQQPSTISQQPAQQPLPSQGGQPSQQGQPEVFHTISAREQASQQQLMRVEQQQASGQKPIKICFACESRRDALLFLNGESAGCSLMSEEDM